MKKFVTINGYGELFVDKVIFETYFPIIFTCINENKDVFLCVCCQNNEKGCKWLVGRTLKCHIVSMLRDKITVRELLLEHSEGRITVDYINGEFKISYNGVDWESGSIFLPKEDSYLYAEEDEFEDDIRYYSSPDVIHYNEMFYTGMVADVGSNITEIELISEDLLNFATNLEKIIITSEVMSTKLEVLGELHEGVLVEKYIVNDSFKTLYKNSYKTSDEVVEIKLETSDDTLADAA